ncbi:hypothetical protein [Streptomyces purpurogeneiscleroticus]|uniref:hypothetical protein n=1 Tax=Streptomyces purpurogeneiscleroticus TaxID=68259 RepID=UPI001CBE4E27|nr:hypothetical protein [Streptomyces purpurogeneiscleroticus]
MTLAAALIGGYVLGRTKKGRLALTAATYLAGRRFGLRPRELAAEGMHRLGEIPQVAELQEQLRGEVLDAGRKAVTAAANRGMTSLADALSERTAQLGSAGEAEEGEEEEEDQGPPRRAAKKAAKKAPAKETTGARRSAAKKKAPGKQETGKQETGKQERSSKRAAKKTAGRAVRRR